MYTLSILPVNLRKVFGKGERGLREGSNLCGVERVSREDVQIVPETLEIKSVESQSYR